MTHEPIQGENQPTCDPCTPFYIADFPHYIPKDDASLQNLIVSITGNNLFSPEIRIATINRLSRALLEDTQTTPVSPMILSTLAAQTFKVVKMLPRDQPYHLQFIDEIVEYAKTVSEHFSPREAASFSASMVKLQACDNDLLDEMSKPLLTNARTLTLRDWADVSIACTRMGFRNTRLLGALVKNCERRIAKTVSVCDEETFILRRVTRDIAILMWMTAKLGLTESECPGLSNMHKSAQQLFASDIKEVGLRAIVDVLWAGARLDVATPSFVNIACAELIQRLSGAGPFGAEQIAAADLATLLYSLAKIGLQHPHDHKVLDCISQRLLPQLPELNSKNLSNLAWSLRVLKHPERQLPIAVAREMCSPRKIHQATPQGLSTLVLSLAKLGLYDENVFRSIADAILNWPEVLSPRDNSNLALGFATIGYYNVDLFSRIMSDVSSVIDPINTQHTSTLRYNDQDITNILWACSNREVFDETFAKACTHYCEDILNTFAPQGLAYLAQYMATFKYNPHGLFETTLDTFLARNPTNWQDLATMAWSASYLSNSPEPLFWLIDQAIIERGGTAPLESLFSIWWAQAFVGFSTSTSRAEILRRDQNEFENLKAAKAASGLFAHLLSAPHEDEPGRLLCERFARDAKIISPEVFARTFWLLSHQRPDWLREYFTPEILNKTQEDRHWIRVYQAAVNAELVDPKAPCARLREITAPSKRLEASARLGRWLQDLKLASADCAVHQLSAGIFIDAVIDTADSPLAIRWAEPEPTAEIGLPLARPLEPLYRSFEASILKKMGFRVIDVLAVDIEDPATSKAAVAIRSALGEAQPS